MSARRTVNAYCPVGLHDPRHLGAGRARRRRDNDDGTPVFTRSPLLNGATAFSQKLPMFEELGAQAMPTSYVSAEIAGAGRVRRLAGRQRARQFPHQALVSGPARGSQCQWAEPVAGQGQRMSGLGHRWQPDRGPPAGAIFRPPALQRILSQGLCPVGDRRAPAPTPACAMREQLHAFAAGTEFGPGGLYYDAAPRRRPTMASSRDSTPSFRSRSQVRCGPSTARSRAS